MRFIKPLYQKQHLTMAQKEVSRNQFIFQSPKRGDLASDPTPVDSQAPSLVGFVGSGKDLDPEKARHPPHVEVSKQGETIDSQSISQDSLAQELPPPNGGLQAWLQVLGAHAVVMVTWYGTCLMNSSPNCLLNLINSQGIFHVFWILPGPLP